MSMERPQTSGEEIGNTVSHVIGSHLGAAMMALLVWQAVNSGTLAPVFSGAALNVDLTSTIKNGTAPYTFEYAGGTLPPGLEVSGSTLSGIPTTPGTYNFTLKVTDAESHVWNDAPYSLNILQKTIVPVTFVDATGASFTTNCIELNTGIISWDEEWYVATGTLNYGTGGITVSGGEPLLQLEFLTELFEKAKDKGVNTCIDTAAGPFTRVEPWFGAFRRLLAATDLLLLDLKHIDAKAHRSLTGADNANVLDCASYLAEIGKPVWIRHVLVPGITTDETALARLGEFIRTLSNVRKVEVLPYHTLGVEKWRSLGLPYALAGVPTPTAEQLERARDYLSIPNL